MLVFWPRWSRVGVERICNARAYLVVGLDVQLDLFAGEGADSVGGEVSLLMRWIVCREREDVYLICMVGGAVCCVCVGEMCGGGVVFVTARVFDRRRLEFERVKRDDVLWWW